MRGIVGELTSAAPLALQLPAVFQEDDFAQRLASAFDVALAPVLATLDDLDAYVDPWLAPEDFLEWLAGWVGVEFVPGWDLATRREVVAGAVAGYHRDATASGIRDTLQRVTGGEVRVSESGGAAWSTTPGAPPPGDDSAALHVQVVVPPGAGGSDTDPDLLRKRVERLVAAMKPAHVVATVEVSER